MKTYIAKWKKLPRSIAREYTNGGTVEEIAIKHGTSSNIVRTALRFMRVKMRKPGSVPEGQRKINSKLTNDQVQNILYLDQNNPEIPHSQMATFFGVSRERIRQICKAAHHITRREKCIPKAVVRQELITARRLTRQQRIRDASEAWKKGMSLRNLSILVYGRVTNTKFIMSRITAWRGDHGVKMFPYRRSNHWQLMTLEERSKKIRDMSVEWNANGDIRRIQKMFGYANYTSAMHALYHLRRKWPDLFDLPEVILERKIKQQTRRK